MGNMGCCKHKMNFAINFIMSPPSELNIRHAFKHVSCVNNVCLSHGEFGYVDV